MTAILVIIDGLLCLDKAGKFNGGNTVGEVRDRGLGVWGDGI